MQCTRNVTNHIIWVGANDRRFKFIREFISDSERGIL